MKLRTCWLFSFHLESPSHFKRAAHHAIPIPQHRNPGWGGFPRDHLPSQQESSKPGLSALPSGPGFGPQTTLPPVIITRGCMQPTQVQALKRRGSSLKERPIEPDQRRIETSPFLASTQRLLPRSQEPGSILPITSQLGKRAHNKRALCVLLQKETIPHRWRSFLVPFVLVLNWILALSRSAVREITETEVLSSSPSRETNQLINVIPILILLSWSDLNPAPTEVKAPYRW